MRRHIEISLLSILLLSLSIGCSDSETSDSPGNSDTMGAGESKEVGSGESDGLDLPEPAMAEALSLAPQVVRLSETNHLMMDREFLLNVPEGYAIYPVAEGMQRVRFLEFSPDGRLFATDMRDLSDNQRGIVWVFDDYDSTTHRYGSRTPWLEGLRNPNNVAFWTDRNGRHWMYIGLTDRLVRYRYQEGSSGPSGPAETLATFPDSGKSYREGGWHLTRTVVIGGDGKIYVSVGSSCNVCVEEEKFRAAIIRMNPDGSNQQVIATGLRNAVGLEWVDGYGLFATNMGADHIGLDRPEDNFYRITVGGDYGWPFAYEYEGEIHPDPSYGSDSAAPSLDLIERSIVGFPAHASPLGLDWFDSSAPPELGNTFLVALHGSAIVSMGRGYSIVRIGGGEILGDFVNGFLVGETRYGRPCDVLQVDDDSFLISDDYAGVIYRVDRVAE